MAATKEITVFVMIDEAGTYVAHPQVEGLRDLYDEVSGEPCLACNVVKLTCRVPRPEMIEIVASPKAG